MEKTKEDRIAEIDARIKDLKEHMVMWGRAGGHGGRMAMQAVGEIKVLELEKNDLINGTNHFTIYKIQKKIEELKLLKKKVSILKKLKYNSEIKKLEEELVEAQGLSVKK